MALNISNGIHSMSDRSRRVGRWASRLALFNLDPNLNPDLNPTPATRPLSTPSLIIPTPDPTSLQTATIPTTATASWGILRGVW